MYGKSIFFSILLLFTFQDTFSRIPQLWGITQGGGVNDKGTIYTVNADGSAYQVVYSFDSTGGWGPVVFLFYQQKFYGVTYYGGLNGLGTLFSYDPLNNVYSVLKHFDLLTGCQNQSSLYAASTGMLYGTNATGGLTGYGTIFTYNFITGLFSVIFDFNDSTGSMPCASLIKGTDDLLYGAAAFGGEYTNGVLFSVDISDNTVHKMYDFENSVARNVQGELCFASIGNLYGTSVNASNHGTIYCYSLDSNTCHSIHNFDSINGKYPVGGLIQASNGLMYGMTFSGGALNYGVFYQIDTRGTFTKLFDFDGTTGCCPKDNLMEASDGKIYGVTNFSLFCWNPDSSSFTVVLDNNTLNYAAGNILEVDTSLLYSVNELAEEQSILIYPNPATNQFAIGSLQFTNGQLEIFNSLGEKIYSAIYQERLIIDCKYFSKGIYFVRIINSEKQLTQKLIIE